MKNIEFLKFFFGSNLIEIFIEFLSSILFKYEEQVE